MKTIVFFLLWFQILSAQSFIRINQLGYTPHSTKVAVLLSKDSKLSVPIFTVHNALTDRVVYSSTHAQSYGAYAAFASTFRLDFSSFNQHGAFYIRVDSIYSPVFRIAEHVYDNSADFLLNYMRQQRSGYNPYLNDSCHTHDGFIIYHPTLDSTHINVSGGWHDASDYLQYVTTSATATYQMMFAYQRNPHAFGDSFGANGRPGSNNIPDILDEAKWGLDWLIKMNPEKDFMFNQLADDRDHRGFRLPTEDTVNYGKGKERPVYFITAKPQGVFQHKNRTTGVASTAGKFASSFALGAAMMKRYYPEFAEGLLQKAMDAYDFGIQFPGVCQTAPCGAPYFYEEDNWTDDMELAAAELYQLTGNKKYLTEAGTFGAMETTTPWLGSDTARHYQWYPFINLGHYHLAVQKETSKEYVAAIKKGIDTVYQRGKSNPFLFGVPFIWCSNNLVSSLLTQIQLYKSLTNDPTYDQMESSLRDWLFGCNIWGTGMIFGLPRWGDTPVDPHSAFTHVYNYPINGGLVDGPVRASIFEQHKKYIRLTKRDPYADVQSDLAVYHDDWGDYTNNEPTMDGTAGLTMYLSSLENKNPRVQITSTTEYGGIVRMDTAKKEIFLLFTGHEFADGGHSILATLKKHNIKASFFFTGDFYRNKKFSSLIEQIKNDAHYLGAHSDKHLLYASWEDRDSTLVSYDTFIHDIKQNYKAMATFGITTADAQYFLPSFEWYNHTISNWTNEYGLHLINFTPGTRSNADYTTPEMPNYLSSDTIVTLILRYEATNPHGLNGFLLLSHIGTSEKRTDKFYSKLDNLIVELKRRGYSFKRL
ncbi:MAG: glycoside hydrolase family 9 protein [Ignavibacteriales bacterium]|nr:glycoside hydrolase family 9 protein [Ignavibacteriales bacterium]